MAARTTFLGIAVLSLAAGASASSSYSYEEELWSPSLYSYSYELCSAECYGTTCDDWSASGFTCAYLTGYGCDCGGGCDCPLDCPDTCYGITCDDWSNGGYTCTQMTAYGCTCSECSCPLDSDVDISTCDTNSDTDCGAGDPWGDGCAAYNDFPSWCGKYDDSDYSSAEMCCGCGGGVAGAYECPADDDSAPMDDPPPAGADLCGQRRRLKETDPFERSTSKKAAQQKRQLQMGIPDGMFSYSFGPMMMFSFSYDYGGPDMMCYDTDNGGADPFGDGCAAYNTNTNWCTSYDDSDFSSGMMCCGCGGGTFYVGGDDDVPACAQSCGSCDDAFTTDCFQCEEGSEGFLWFEAECCEDTSAPTATPPEPCYGSCPSCKAALEGSCADSCVEGTDDWLIVQNTCCFQTSYSYGFNPFAYYPCPAQAIVSTKMGMTGLACSDYGTEEEAATNAAVASLVDGVEDGHIGDHVCTDAVSRRMRGLLSDEIEIAFDITVTESTGDDASALAASDLAASISTQIETAANSGALQSTIVASASTDSPLASMTVASVSTVSALSYTSAPSAAPTADADDTTTTNTTTLLVSSAVSSMRAPLVVSVITVVVAALLRA